MRACKAPWLALVALLGCDDEAPLSQAEAMPWQAPAATSPASDAASASAAPAASALVDAHEPVCAAPSLAADGPLDGRSDADYARCVPPSTGPAEASRRCGRDKAVPPLDLARLDRAVLPIDAATLAHARAVFARGKEMKRRADVFALVGDSMTVSGAFLRHPPRHMAPEVAARLRTRVGDRQDASIVDYYAGVKAAHVRGGWADSFGGPRAAKVGARATWPLIGGAGSPLMLLLQSMSPAVAILLYGGNDAAFRVAPVADLADQFEADLGAVIDALEAEGIIVVLNTLARHGHGPGYPDCAEGRELTNWGLAVQTNALSARVVEIACRRHLPLIDVRDALDAGVNLGLGPDGIHPSDYRGGADVLDARGLRCGYNIRNYVTLLMLKQLKELVFDG